MVGSYDCILCMNQSATCIMLSTGWVLSNSVHHHGTAHCGTCIGIHIVRKTSANYRECNDEQPDSTAAERQYVLIIRIYNLL